MASLSWISSKSADWATAADWTNGTVPGASDDVTIAVAGVTVTVGTGQQAASSVTTTSSVLSIAGGTLAVGSFANLHGAFQESAGLFSVAGQGLTFFGAAALSGGTLAVTAGTFTADAGFTDTGATVTLAGQGATFAGATTLSAGSVTQQSGTFLSSGGYTGNGGVLTLSGANAAFTGSATTLSAGAVVFQGGTLSIGTALGISGGTLALAGQAENITGPLTLTTGLVNLISGVLTDSGAIAQSGGSFALSSAATLSGTVTLSGGTMALKAGSLLSSGGFTVDGGTLSLGGQASFSNGLTLSSGQITLVSGSFIDNGGFVQTGGSFVLAGQGGTFNGATTLTSGTQSVQNLLSTGGFVQTGGTLSLSGTGGQFNNNLVQTGGTLRAQTGSITLYGGANSLSGTIAGAGTLLEAGAALGLAGTTTLGSATVLSVAHVSVVSGVLALAQSGKPYGFGYGGYLSVTSQGTVSLGGNTLTLSGRAQLGGDLTGGTVVASGGGQLNGLVLDNSALLDIGSAVTLTAQNDGPGLATLKADSRIAILAGGSLKLTGNDTIADLSANGTITDAGLLTRAGGAATAEIAPSFSETGTGSIAIALGTVDFSGANNAFSGAISGAGTFSLGASNNGSATADVFGSGLALGSGGFVLTGLNTQLTVSNSLSYGGSWDQSGGVFLLGSQGQTLTLSLTGSTVLDGGVVKSSAGTIATTGLVNLSNSPQYNAGFAIEGFTNFTVADQALQDAQIQLGASSSSKPTATILHGASWLMEDAASIQGAFGVLVNDGTLEKYSGSVAGTIQSDLINNGVLKVDADTLVLDGSGALGGTAGTATVSGAGQLALEGSGTYVLSTGTNLTVSQVLIDNTPSGPQSSVVALASTVTGTTTLTSLTYGGVWAQHGGTVQLDSDTLTLKGTAALDGGVLSGPGTLVTAGALTLGGSTNAQFSLSGGAVLDVTKAGEQSGDITVGGLATLMVAKGVTLTQDDSVNILGSGTLSVAGNLVANGNGFEQVDPSTVVTGAIQLDHGEMSFLGGVTGTGSMVVHAGAELDLMNAVSATNTINLSAGSASLLIGDAAAYDGVVTGFSSGDFIELSALASGTITDTLSMDRKSLTISDSAGHTFTLQFAQAQTASSLQVADGPHGFIGIYHT